MLPTAFLTGQDASSNAWPHLGPIAAALFRPTKSPGFGRGFYLTKGVNGGERSGFCGCRENQQDAVPTATALRSEVNFAASPLLALHFGSHEDITSDEAKVFIIQVAHLHKHIGAAHAGMHI